MKYTKKGVACVLGALLLAGTSQAAIQTPGGSCRAQSEGLVMNYSSPVALLPPILFSVNPDAGPENYSPDMVKIFCPIPAEIGVGEVANFTITVHDESPTDNVRCTAGALDREGDVVALSSTVVSSVTGRGKRTLTPSIELTDE